MSFICTETLDFAVFFLFKKNNNRTARSRLRREREREIAGLEMEVTRRFLLCVSERKKKSGC